MSPDVWCWVCDAVGKGWNYCDQQVCVFCRSARISHKPRSKFYQNFLTFSQWLWLGPPTSDGNAIYYVFLVLKITLCYHIIERMGQNQRRQGCLVYFAKWQHRGQSLPSPTVSRFLTVWFIDISIVTYVAVLLTAVECWDGLTSAS